VKTKARPGWRSGSTRTTEQRVAFRMRLARSIRFERMTLGSSELVKVCGSLWMSR
jgi:hypothetical protein